MPDRKAKKSKGAPQAKSRVFVWSTNPFAFIYSDANLFQKKAQKARNRDMERTYARTAVLLFVLATEALINRVLDCFVREDLPRFVKDKISQLPLDMKWYMAPLLCADDTHHTTFQAGREPFQSFRELIQIRNSCVHPFPRKQSVTLLKATAKSLAFSTTERLEWPQTKIARNAQHMDKKSASGAGRVVDQMIDLLNEYLGGRIKKEGWWQAERLTPVPKTKEC